MKSALTGVCTAHMDGLMLGNLVKKYVQTKGANFSILGAICKSDLITLPRKEVVLNARSGK